MFSQQPDPLTQRIHEILLESKRVFTEESFDTDSILFSPRVCEWQIQVSTEESRKNSNVEVSGVFRDASGHLVAI